MKKNMPTTKEGVEQRIKEILAKHPAFQGAEISVIFKKEGKEAKSFGRGM